MLMTESKIYLEEVNKILFAPHELQATVYAIRKNDQNIWKHITLADTENNKDLIDKLTSSYLKKGEICFIKVKFSSSNGAIRLLIHWTHDNSKFGAYLNFDSEEEAIKEGWII